MSHCLTFTDNQALTATVIHLQVCLLCLLTEQACSKLLEAVLPSPSAPAQAKQHVPFQSLVCHGGRTPAHGAGMHLSLGMLLAKAPINFRGGTVPTGGAVTLPANTKIIVAACSFPSTPTFSYIRIPASSQLIFADQDVSMNVGSFMVDGQLRIGSPTCRFNSRVVITFSRSSGSPVTDADFGLQVCCS